MAEIAHRFKFSEHSYVEKKPSNYLQAPFSQVIVWFMFDKYYTAQSAVCCVVDDDLLCTTQTHIIGTLFCVWCCSTEMHFIGTMTGENNYMLLNPLCNTREVFAVIELPFGIHFSNVLHVALIRVYRSNNDNDMYTFMSIIPFSSSSSSVQIRFSTTESMLIKLSNAYARFNVWHSISYILGTTTPQMFTHMSAVVHSTEWRVATTSWFTYLNVRQWISRTQVVNIIVVDCSLWRWHRCGHAGLEVGTAVSFVCLCLCVCNWISLRVCVLRDVGTRHAVAGGGNVGVVCIKIVWMCDRDDIDIVWSWLCRFVVLVARNVCRRVCVAFVARRLSTFCMILWCRSESQSQSIWNFCVGAFACGRKSMRTHRPFCGAHQIVNGVYCSTCCIMCKCLIEFSSKLLLSVYHQLKPTNFWRMWMWAMTQIRANTLC